MKEKIKFITVKHYGEPVQREDEEYRRNVVGPNCLRPIRDPLSEDWREQYSEEELSVKTPEAGLSPAESLELDPARGAHSAELPVETGTVDRSG